MTTSNNTTLSLAGTVQQALDSLDSSLAGMIHLVPSIALLPRTIQSELWPRPGPPKPPSSRDRSMTQPPAGIPPEEVKERWNRGGPDWLRQANRRELRAAVLALLVEDVGLCLAKDARYLEALLPRVCGRHQAMAISAAVFSCYPCHPHVIKEARKMPSSWRRPVWWATSGWPGISSDKLAIWLGNEVIANRLAQPGDLDVPAIAWSSKWCETAIDMVSPQSIRDVRSQLIFAQKGGKISDNVLDAASLAAIDGGIKLAQKNGSMRQDMAILARERVGSPFGPMAEAKWRPVIEFLPLIRSWLAGQVLSIVFNHLTPPNNSTAHMTAPRMVFWADYTGSVVRMWVSVTPRIAPQLKHPNLVKLREVMGDALSVCKLYGSPEQAIVWIHLRTKRGDIITVTEGNANTSIRIFMGGLSPRYSCIDYSVDIKSRNPGPVFSTAHHGDWQAKTKEALYRLGVS